MDIIREDWGKPELGESSSEWTDGNNAKSLPAPAVNLQEVMQKEKIASVYRLNLSYPHDIFNMNPIFDKRSFGAGWIPNNDFVGRANIFIDKSQAPYSLFAPKFSTNIHELSNPIDFTAKVSMYSDATFTSVMEAYSVSTTRRLVHKYRNLMKKEGIDKEVMLMVGMNQDEEKFALKYKMAEKESIKFVMSSWEKPKERWRNFETVASYYNSNITRIMSNVPKNYKNRSSVLPTVTLLADVFSHAPITGRGDDTPKNQRRLTEAEKKRKSIINASKYYMLDGGLYRFGDYNRAHITNQDCGCQLCQHAGSTQEDFFREFNNHLYEATGTHNTIAIHEAVTRLRGNIGNGLVNILNRRPYARKILEELYHINRNQKHLEQ